MNITKTISIMTVATVAALTSGCAATYKDNLSPTAMHGSINVAESIERLELYTRPNGLELSARDKLAVAQFLDGYRQNGSGALFINRPSAQANNAGTRQAEVVIRDLMRNGGLNPSSLQGGQYQSNPHAPAPVVVSYRALKAIPDNCRKLEPITNTFSNQPQANFGCFHSANLAAMIGDPRQLLEPYEFGKPDAQRRQVVYDRYIQGETTGAQFPSRQRPELPTN
ncbi:MAG: CpaD family pilus assembly lipoprotein [Litorimonas sp.]